MFVSGIIEKLAQKQMGKLERKMDEVIEVLEEISEKLDALLGCLDCQKQKRGKGRRG